MSDDNLILATSNNEFETHINRYIEYSFDHDDNIFVVYYHHVNGNNTVILYKLTDLITYLDSLTSENIHGIMYNFPCFGSHKLNDQVLEFIRFNYKLEEKDAEP
jgi:predicted amino acid racemase